VIEPEALIIVGGLLALGVFLAFYGVMELDALLVVGCILFFAAFLAFAV
jgi:hypothetical protein